MMRSNLEETGKHRVKITVEVPPEEAKPLLETAYRHIAGSIKVPGFRKGKVPRKIVEAQVGRGPILQEFLEHALSRFYPEAIREHALAPIGDPEFDDLEIENIEGHGFGFSATVEVRPRLRFDESDYKGIRLERPSSAVSDSELDEQLDRLRERFAELEVVTHPARRGDYVVADIRGSLHDQEVPEVSGQDLLYEVGSQALVPKLDEELEGKRKGDILKFNAELPQSAGDRAGQEVSFTVLVKEVKQKRLPELDDEFARTSSEFDTLEELREDVRAKMVQIKEGAVDAALRDRALQALVERVDVELPDSLVDSETESRVRSAAARAERQGASLEQALRASGLEELEFRSDARAHAIRAIKADLALEGVARAEGLQVSAEDLDEAVERIASEIGRPAKEVRKSLESSGQITSLAGDIIRDRALNLIVEHADVGDDRPPPTGEGKNR